MQKSISLSKDMPNISLGDTSKKSETTKIELIERGTRLTFQGLTYVILV